MSKHFLREFNQIHQQLLDLFGVVEQMVTHSVSAFCQRQFDLGHEVIARDDLVDQTEVQIEEACLKAMALYQPVAIELRRLATIMKINNQLERIADLACNIAKRGQGLREFPAYQVPNDLPRLAELGINLVAKSLDSFVNLDTDTARNVIQGDHEVDQLNKSIIRSLVESMKQNPSDIEPILYCFSVSRYLERIGDHAVNIAEDVVYLVDGEIVRHQPVVDDLNTQAT